MTDEQAALLALLLCPAYRVAQHERSDVPADYLWLIDTFGPIYVDEFFWILVPGSRNPALDLHAQSERFLRDVEERLEDVHSRQPVRGGKPWAVTDNGDLFLWRQQGPPDEWTVVVRDQRADVEVDFALGTVPFLLALLRGELRTSGAFPDDFPLDHHLVQRLED